jgi:hypothetical protein
MNCAAFFRYFSYHRKCDPICITRIGYHCKKNKTPPSQKKNNKINKFFSFFIRKIFYKFLDKLDSQKFFKKLRYLKNNPHKKKIIFQNKIFFYNSKIFI